MELNEKLYTNKLKSGIKCYIIPKKGYVESRALICTNYGSLDNSFEVDGKRKDMPKGIAHFLEHKLFEEEKINIFDEFAKLGADVNAFTNFTTTAYYFSCTENFDKCLKLLLEFVGRPYFTDSNVEKEKGIISQEIKMYDDDADWIVYFNMLKAMYKVHPAKENIAGSVQSINEITKDMLYDCYNTFYAPQNMAVICVGNVDKDSVCDLIDRTVSQKKAPKVKRMLIAENEESANVFKSFTSAKLSVSAPIFCMGFKENDFSTAFSRKWAASKILMDILAGESSNLYLNLINQNLIDNSFGADYMGNSYFGTGLIFGLSDNPQQVYESVKKEIEKLKYLGIPDSDFERIKAKQIGRFIRIFNSPSAICQLQTDCFSRDSDFLTMHNALINITKQDVTDRLTGFLNDNNTALSVVENEKNRA